jgi:polyphosphate kinase 2 (PPK2 family)
MDYDQTLYELRIELVKLQRHCISREERLLVIFEGRDAAGKDGTLRRIIRHLSPSSLSDLTLIYCGKAKFGHMFRSFS